MEKRYLISVGINDYLHAPLNYCVKDAEDIVKCFLTFCNVKKENAYVITSSTHAPSRGIPESLQTTIARIQTEFVPMEDSIFFHFSGHGVRSKDNTKLLFHKDIVELQEVFDDLMKLRPKFIFCLIDSCYSGVGIEDTIGRSIDELTLSQHLGVASGYHIICASSEDSPAKEDSNVRNGRLTRLFIDIIQNKVNYKNGILPLSKIYQLVDDAFKNNPLLRQFPFAQSRGLSTYPLGVEDDHEMKSYFSTHYIINVGRHDWQHFKRDLLEYCGIRLELVHEFTRLVREILRNCDTWSKATFLKLEVGNGRVSIIDNSGKFFDIFNPKPDVKLRGGGKTAAIFRNNYEKEFSYSATTNANETIQTFDFRLDMQGDTACRWIIRDIEHLWEFQAASGFQIPETCREYLIDVPHGAIDLSTVHSFLRNLILASQKSKKAVRISMSSKDKLKDEFVRALEDQSDLGAHLVTISATID